MISSSGYAQNSDRVQGSLQLFLKLKYLGSFPESESLENQADIKVCGSRIQRKLVEKGQDGGLIDAAAWLVPQGPHMESKKIDGRELPVEILNIKNCEFNRRVILIRPNQSLKIFSEDPINFALFFAAHENPPFSLSLPPNLQMRSVSFKKPEIIPLRGGIHESLSSYLFITDEPRIGLSNATGEVKISGIQAGTYDLHLWHPQLGFRKYSSSLLFEQQNISLEIGLRDSVEKQK